MNDGTALAKVNDKGLTEERQKAVEHGMVEIQRTFQENTEQRERIHKLLEETTTMKVEIDLLRKALEIERQNTKAAEADKLQAEVDRAHYEALFKNIERILQDFIAPVTTFSPRLSPRKRDNG